ncbi:restriction endonuclease subunit S [Jannaschia sp. LMIT008]|uniref:restriction endonuclease subunit S n=1 Tax=Jannaschia maritima TaxID=3032585 RepID=UPI0028112F27|nr:restriction endonuclease subunit S [Jannaschia sp. LMIT008]
MQAGIPRLAETPNGWHVQRIGDLLEPVHRRVNVSGDEEYLLVTAKRNRGGLVERERKFGRDILTPTQFRAAADDFVISRRQIAHGACGILPPELDGALVSNEYSTLRPTAQMNADYLRHLPHSIYFQQTCFHSSIGVHVEKLVFDLEDWLSWPINTPPLSEQRRIAAVLDAWDAAIALSERLVAAKRRRRDGALDRLINHKTDRRRELGDFVALRKTKAEVADLPSDARVIELEDVESASGRLLRTRAPDGLSGMRAVYQEGDVLFAKLRPYLRKFVHADHDGAASTEMWVLTATPKLCASRYLFYLVQSRPFSAEASRPTGSRMPRADWECVSEAPLYLPSLDEQQKIAATLDALTSEIDLIAARTDLLRAQKRGLMQRLLTGAVRVPESLDALMPAPPREAAE